MKSIAIINQKGGVGKSTSALSIGAGLILQGFKVLFIDLDAQGNLTHTLDVSSSVTYSAMDVLSGSVHVEQSIIHTSLGDLSASSPSLAGADVSLLSTGKEYRLREALSSLAAKYDYAIIDTPPSLGILTVNALTACYGCIIPAQADIYSLQGISQLYATIDVVRKYCNPALTVLGILLTRYNGRAIIGREVAEMIEQTAEKLNTKLYATRVRECTAIKESQAVRKSIFDYAPRSNAAIDYASLIDEMLTEDKLNGK